MRQVWPGREIEPRPPRDKHKTSKKSFLFYLKFDLFDFGPLDATL